MTPVRSDFRQEPKACAQCFKAKAKCIWDGVPGNTCVRCARLHKDCKLRAVATTSPRSTSTAGEQHATPDARFAELEDRIAFLARRVGSIDGSPAPRLPTSARGPRTLLSPPACQSNALVSPIIIDVEHAAAQLSLYRQHLAPLFPFILVPTVPVEHFAAEQPLLYQAVVMASLFRDRPQQAKEGARLRQLLSHLAFVNGEKSLDLLQAVIMLVAFYHVHIHARSQISNLMNLAMALLADLGLDKPSDENDRRKLIFDSSRTSYGFNTARTQPPKASNEQRCALACFYLSSVVSVAFTRVDPMRFTRYFEHICVVLSETGLVADAYAVRLVQIQALTNRIRDTLPLDELGYPPSYDCSKAPVAMHMDGLRDAIASLDTASSAADATQEANLKLHRAVATTCLYEVSLFDRAWKSSNFLPSSRLDAAYLCLRGVDDFFSTLLELRCELLYAQPYVIWGQLAYALLICSRLSLLRFPGWTSTNIKSIIDFPVLLDRLFQKLSQAGTLFVADGAAPSPQTSSSVNQRDAFFARTAEKLMKIKDWFLKNVDDNAASLPQHSASSNTIVDSSFVPNYSFQDFLMGNEDAELDENFWLEPSQFQEAI